MHPAFDQLPKNPFPKSHSENVVINVVVSVASNVTRLTLDTDESYSLTIEPDSQKVRETDTDHDTLKKFWCTFTHTFYNLFYNNAFSYSSEFA